MTMRAMGATNARLPVPTGMVIGFIKDPKTFAYNRYTQFIPVPDDALEFSYWKIDNDEPVRMQSGTATNSVAKLDDFVWGYDSYPPKGQDFNVRMDMLAERVTRYAFPYVIGDEMKAQWSKVGLNPESLYNQVRASHAGLHRAIRIVNSITGATWTGSTGTIQSLLGLSSPAFFDDSTGEELLPSGLPNDNFRIILNTFQKVKRRLYLNTNGALSGAEMVAVLSPSVAEAIAKSGEMMNFLKQSSYAKELTSPNIVNWNLPDSYGGFTLVVEDTPRVFLNKLEAGTEADRSLTSSADYVLNSDDIYFLSRPGGVDGGYGMPSFSSVQCYTKNGLAQVKSNSDSWLEMTEARITMEDKIILPSMPSAFRVQGVLK